MHPLNDVPARVKHSSDVLGVNGSGEMWVAEMPPIMSFHADFLQYYYNAFVRTVSETIIQVVSYAGCQAILVSQPGGQAL